MSVPWYLMAKGKGGGGYKTASGPIVSISDALAAPLRSLRVGIDPVQAGTGDPSPDNVRPISGWTEANLWRTGKNLAKLSSENAGDNQRSTVSYTDSGAVVTATGVYGRYGWLIPVKAGCTYTISDKAVASDAANNNRIYFGSKTAWSVDSDGYLSWHTVTTTETQYSVTVTVPSDTLFIGVYVSALGSSGSITISDLQVELSSTPTPYAPYTGNQYPIQLGQTVYGGHIQVGADGSAELVVDRGYDQMTYSYLSSLTTSYIGYGVATGDSPTIWVRNWKYSEIAPRKAGGVFGICNAFPVSIHDTNIFASQNRIYFFVDSNITSVSDFLDVVQALEVNGSGLYLCYELATPLTYTLTPQQLDTLAGQNVMWADCGDVTVEYLSAGGANPDLMKLAVAFMGR